MLASPASTRSRFRPPRTPSFSQCQVSSFESRVSMRCELLGNSWSDLHLVFECILYCLVGCRTYLRTREGVFFDEAARECLLGAAEIVQESVLQQTVFSSLPRLCRSASFSIDKAMSLSGRMATSARRSLGSCATSRSLGRSSGVTFGFLAVWYPVWHALLVDGVVSQIELSAHHHGEFLDVRHLPSWQLRELALARVRLTNEASCLRDYGRKLDEKLFGVQAWLCCLLCRTAFVVFSGSPRSLVVASRSVLKSPRPFRASWAIVVRWKLNRAVMRSLLSGRAQGASQHSLWPREAC